jgi:hypothetical protein
MDDTRRRQLNFKNLSEAAADVAALHQTGYERKGQWDLGKICDHLIAAIEQPMDGYDIQFPWYYRPFIPLVGSFILKRTLATRRLMEGSPTAPRFVPRTEGVDEGVWVDRFQATVDRLHTWAGPLHPSPLFGRISKEQFEEFQSIHASHHLSFLHSR